MRKPAITLATLFFSVMIGHGKANFFTRDELIQNAEVIAIIDLGEPEVPEPGPRNDPFAAPGEGRRGEFWNYTQSSKAKVVELIKGRIDVDFTMYGGEGFICAQCDLSKGRFLAFLKKDGELWVGANWQRSLRPVSDGKVEWYDSVESRWPQAMQPLDAVRTEVRKVLAEAVGEKAMGEPAILISARLRAAATSEREIAGSLIDSFGAILGIKIKDLKPAQREQIRTLVEKHAGVSKELADIVSELGKQAGNEVDGVSSEVLKGMKDAKAAELLGDLGTKISKGHYFTASEGALSLAKRFDAWADLLEGKAPEKGEGK